MVVNVYVSAVTTDNISRHDALAWVNNNLQASLSKIEEMATGAAYCQLTHMIFPDQISLKKIKFNSKSEVDHLNNWKVLVTAWKHIGIDKPVHVDKLMKGKFQDNYEFLQWFYKFFNTNIAEGIEDYDAVAQRSGEAFPSGGKVGAVRPAVRAPPKAAPVPATTRRVAPAPLASKPTRVPSVNGGDSQLVQQHEATIAALQDNLKEYVETLATIETERDFYFNKLRVIEDMCKDTESVPSAKIQAILYESNDNEDQLEVGAEAVVEEVAAASLDDSETF